MPVTWNESQDSRVSATVRLAARQDFRWSALDHAHHLLKVGTNTMIFRMRKNRVVLALAGQILAMSTLWRSLKILLQHSSDKPNDTWEEKPVSPDTSGDCVL